MPTILLVHGYHRTAASLEPMAMQLRKHGYTVLTPNLPTTKERLGTCVHCLETYLDQQDFELLPKPLHLLGHSYGGLILRGLLARRSLPYLASLTCLGSSHLGTRAANLICLLGASIREKAVLEFRTPGPIIAEPQQGWPSVVHLIAGSVRNDLRAGLFMPRPNDGRLPVSSALAQNHDSSVVQFPTWTKRTILPLDHHQLEYHPDVILALLHGIDH